MRRRNPTARRLSWRSARALGQGLVEFALVVPLMLLILLIAVDFGRLFFAHLSNVNAAREGANYAAAHAADASYSLATFNAGAANAATAQANAQGQSGGGVLTVTPPFCFAPSAPSTSIDCNVASNFATGTGNEVTVTVSQPFTFLTPLIGNLFGGSLTLVTSATAPVLNPLVATVVTQTSTSTSSTSTSTTSTTTTSTTTSSTTSTTTTTTVACIAPVVTISPSNPHSNGNQTTLDVTFTGSATPGSVTAWAWDFGDGGTSNVERPPQHTYTYTLAVDKNGHPTATQTWPVTLTVTTTAGCTGTGTTTAKVH
jgi:Flp pilus assembly protein TadG